MIYHHILLYTYADIDKYILAIEYIHTYSATHLYTYTHIYTYTPLLTYTYIHIYIYICRTSKLWVEQGEAAGWLINSPQARLEGYNPLVMSKLIMLRDAARMNPWGARYHMWMDAGHLCAGSLSPKRMSM